MTATPSMADATATIDVRDTTPRDRHAAVLAAFHALDPRESLDTVSDHDPWPLHLQLQGEAPGTFSWTCLMFGPDDWRVRIHKVARTHAGGGCCGHCGGGT